MIDDELDEPGPPDPEDGGGPDVKTDPVPETDPNAEAPAGVEP